MYLVLCVRVMLYAVVIRIDDKSFCVLLETFSRTETSDWHDKFCSCYRNVAYPLIFIATLLFLFHPFVNYLLDYWTQFLFQTILVDSVYPPKFDKGTYSCLAFSSSSRAAGSQQRSQDYLWINFIIYP